MFDKISYLEISVVLASFLNILKLKTKWLVIVIFFFRRTVGGKHLMRFPRETSLVLFLRRFYFSGVFISPAFLFLRRFYFSVVFISPAFSFLRRFHFSGVFISPALCGCDLKVVLLKIEIK